MKEKNKIISKILDPKKKRILYFLTFESCCLYAYGPSQLLRLFKTHIFPLTINNNFRKQLSFFKEIPGTLIALNSFQNLMLDKVV